MTKPVYSGLPGAPPNTCVLERMHASKLLLEGTVVTAAEQKRTEEKAAEVARRAISPLSLVIPGEEVRAPSTRMGGTPLSPVPYQLLSPPALIPVVPAEKGRPWPPGGLLSAHERMRQAQHQERAAQALVQQGIEERLTKELGAAQAILSLIPQLTIEQDGRGYSYFEGDVLRLYYDAQEDILDLTETPGVPREWVLPQEFLTGRLNPAEKRHFLPHFSEKGLFLGMFVTACNAPSCDAKTPLNLTSLQAVMLLDLCTYNINRDWDSLAVEKETLISLYSGWILPDKFAPPTNFCWMARPDSDAPFTPESMKAIRELSFEKDRSMILSYFPNYPQEKLDLLQVCYYLVKQAAERGFTPRFIAKYFMQGYLTRLYQTFKGRVEDMCTVLDLETIRLRGMMLEAQQRSPLKAQESLSGASSAAAAASSASSASTAAAATPSKK